GDFLSELEDEERDRRLLERLEEIWLLRTEVDLHAPGFALRQALRSYPTVFADHGLHVGDSEAAAWVQRRPPHTGDRIIAALDAWLRLAQRLKAAEAGWLLNLLQTCDEDAWRTGLRAALARDDVQEVERLASSEAMQRQRAQTVLLLADYFRPK